ncbi:hypothetical protein SAMN05444370_11095 [Rubrimonas cliftonensis]|uniref:Uncharacterized protein n=2 Tax=Rubrimonas cliftonensis TaxID=89524 RepID=A0A1H4DK93_9RHOB|nr:hypothetical protein SAMN05444370_11095 [Rubrimonas cliftonensis]
MLGRLAAVLSVALAGCDDVERITRVDALVSNLRSRIVPMAAGGLPTEVHGAPFAGLSAGEVVARLRLPNGWPADIGFRAATPADASRLVLVFNPTTAPDGYALCRGVVPPTGAGGEKGFSALATFCESERPLVTGFLEAPNVRADAPEAFAAAMTRLFQQMLD